MPFPRRPSSSNILSNRYNDDDDDDGEDSVMDGIVIIVAVGTNGRETALVGLVEGDCCRTTKAHEGARRTSHGTSCKFRTVMPIQKIMMIMMIGTNGGNAIANLFALLRM